MGLGHGVAITTITVSALWAEFHVNGENLVFATRASLLGCLSAQLVLPLRPDFLDLLTLAAGTRATEAGATFVARFACTVREVLERHPLANGFVPQRTLLFQNGQETLVLGIAVIAMSLHHLQSLRLTRLATLRILRPRGKSALGADTPVTAGGLVVVPRLPLVAITAKTFLVGTLVCVPLPARGCAR